MSRFRVVFPLLVGSVLLCTVQSADAQYSPAYRPTLSPYLHYFRRDPGPLGTYFSYVRPRLELQRTLAVQTADLQRQQARIQTLQGEVSQIGQSGARMPTGTGSVFMNYSHYYPTFGSGGYVGSRSRAYSRPPSRGYSGSRFGQPVGRSMGYSR